MWPCISSLLLLCDNLSVKYLAQNLILHAHLKHIELDHPILGYHVMKGAQQIAHFFSHQLTDVLTKPL